MQRSGSFKIRGAYNTISRLNDEEKARGVIAASAGNHAQGVALAAKLCDVKATIFFGSTRSFLSKPAIMDSPITPQPINAKCKFFRSFAIYHSFVKKYPLGQNIVV